jgi:hypothetical protein
MLAWSGLVATGAVRSLRRSPTPLLGVDLGRRETSRDRTTNRNPLNHLGFRPATFPRTLLPGVYRRVRVDAVRALIVADSAQ